jgi:hypothetical protein
MFKHMFVDHLIPVLKDVGETVFFGRRFSRARTLANEQRKRYKGWVSLRTCRVTCSDMNGVEHAVEVTADSLYEALARGLVAFRDAAWAGDIGHGQTTITVVIKQPEVEQKVRMRYFEAWLESNAAHRQRWWL